MPSEILCAVFFYVVEIKHQLDNELLTLLSALVISKHITSHHFCEYTWTAWLGYPCGKGLIMLYLALNFRLNSKANSQDTKGKYMFITIRVNRLWLPLLQTFSPSLMHRKQSCKPQMKLHKTREWKNCLLLILRKMYWLNKQLPEHLIRKCFFLQAVDHQRALEHPMTWKNIMIPSSSIVNDLKDLHVI